MIWLGAWVVGALGGWLFLVGASWRERTVLDRAVELAMREFDAELVELLEGDQ